jgi:DNA gyrase subunit B
MSFRRGEPGRFDDTKGISADSPFTPFEDESSLDVVGKVAKGVTGTRVRYWVDPQIFIKDASFATDELMSRARQTAFLVPGLKLQVTDRRSSEAVVSDFKFDGGIVEFVDFLAPDNALTATWRLSGSTTFSETVPVLNDQGNMESREVERN